MFEFPLMVDNVSGEDLDVLVEFLQSRPRLTQSANVAAFEEEWSAWLGVKRSLYVNSGSSANQITLGVLKIMLEDKGIEGGEVIVPTLTWVSDVAAVLQAGFTPVFVDIDRRTLGMDSRAVVNAVTDKTRAVFLTHIQGFNAFDDRMLDACAKRGIPLIEDVCESHGATFKGRKCGSMGWVSNFSFYFAHHMSTVEGGMVCTNDETFYQYARMFRSHGMVREASDPAFRQRWIDAHPDLSPDFIFAFPAFNMRHSEMGAVIGRNQLKRLDSMNAARSRNLEVFFAHLDSAKYRTDFAVEGSSNYAFNLVLQKPDQAFSKRLEEAMRAAGVEFRRGSSGGGNQLRQPYLKKLFPEGHYATFPEVEHIHFYAWYIGNYPSMPEDKIKKLCQILNAVQ